MHVHTCGVGVCACLCVRLPFYTNHSTDLDWFNQTRDTNHSLTHPTACPAPTPLHTLPPPCPPLTRVVSGLSQVGQRTNFLMKPSSRSWSLRASCDPFTMYRSFFRSNWVCAPSSQPKYLVGSVHAITLIGVPATHISEGDAPCPYFLAPCPNSHAPCPIYIASSRIEKNSRPQNCAQILGVRT